MNTWLCRECGGGNDTSLLSCECGASRPSYGQLAVLRQALATSPGVSLTNHSTDNSRNNGVIFHQPVIHNYYEQTHEPAYTPVETVDAEVVDSDTSIAPDSILGGLLSGLKSAAMCAFLGAIAGGLYGYGGADPGNDHSGSGTFVRVVIWGMLGIMIGTILNAPIRIIGLWRAMTRNRPILAILTTIPPIWLAAYWTTAFLDSDGFGSMKHGNLAAAFIGSLVIAAWSFVIFIFLIIVHAIFKKSACKVEDGPGDSLRAD